MMNNYVKYIFLSIISLVLLSGCYPLRRVGLIQERKGLPDYKEGEYVAYKLQKNDEIVIRVITQNDATASLFDYGNAGNANSRSSVSYRVYEDGTIDLPYVKKIKVEGYTLEQTKAIIEEKLKDFADDIQVKVALNTATFCVIGDAGRGYFPIYRDRLTIYQALALSGGLNESADFAHVKILRKINGETKIVQFDIRTKSIVDSDYYYIYPNDIIYVDVSKRRFWAVNSYSAFIGLISSSLSMLITVWNVFNF